MDLSSSPIPFPFFLLVHSIAGCPLRLEENVVLLVTTSFVVLMVLVGNRNEREDEDPSYEDDEGFEMEEDLEGSN